MTKLSELLANNLLRIMDERGLKNKSELARAAGVLAPTMSLYVNQKRDDVSFSSVETIAEGLKIEPWELLMPPPPALNKAKQEGEQPVHVKSKLSFNDAVVLFRAFETAPRGHQKFALAILARDERYLSDEPALLQAYQAVPK